MKRIVLATALALALGGTAHAAVIDVDTGLHPATVTAAGGPREVSQLASRMSELPEPEVFAMMLVGLVLIGYRARRDSNEKFK